MDRYTHVAMYRLSTYIGVHMVRVKCEKYSLKSEILGENSVISLYHTNTFLYICDNTNGHIHILFNAIDSRRISAFIRVKYCKF